MKTLENILFEYPVREDNGSLDEEFQVLKKQLTKLKYAVMISSFCALAMYFLSNSKAIAKEFGNEDDYYNRIYEGNN